MEKNFSHILNIKRPFRFYYDELKMIEITNFHAATYDAYTHIYKPLRKSFSQFSYHIVLLRSL